MPVEIKTETRKVMREVEETVERVHLDVSIQEAHYIHALLGGGCAELGRLYGVANTQPLYRDLNVALGDRMPTPGLRVVLLP